MKILLFLLQILDTRYYDVFYKDFSDTVGYIKFHKSLYQEFNGSILTLSLKSQLYTFNDVTSKKGKTLPTLGVEFSFQPLRNLTLHGDYSIFYEIGTLFNNLPYYDALKNPLFDFKKQPHDPVVGDLKNLEVKSDWAYAKISPHGNLNILIGSLPLKIGSGMRTSLLLSGYSRPLTYLYNVNFKENPFNIMVFYAHAQDTTPLKRLACQRIEFSPNPKISINLTELVIWSHPEDPLKYLNPLNFYYITQRRSNTNLDNLMASLEVVFKNKLGEFYAEFLNDDFLISPQTEKNRSLFGVLLGSNLKIREYTNLLFETNFISPFTYSHFTRVNSLSFDGFPIGAYQGPNSLNFFLQISENRKNLFNAIFIEGLLKGYGDLKTPLEEVDPDTLLTKPKEKRLSIGILTFKERFFNMDIDFACELRLERIWNLSHIRGNSSLRGILKLMIGYKRNFTLKDKHRGFSYNGDNHIYISP